MSDRDNRQSIAELQTPYPIGTDEGSRGARFDGITIEQLYQELKDILPVVVTDGAKTLGRYATIEDAEAYIAYLETIMPEDVHSGRFGVDAPEWMLI